MAFITVQKVDNILYNLLIYMIKKHIGTRADKHACTLSI